MKTTTGIGVMALTLCVSHLALGEESEGSTIWDGFSGFLNPDWSEDFSASVGVKVWMNEWTQDTFFSQGASVSDGGSLVITAVATDTRPDSRVSEDIEPTPIPQLGIRYKWLFLAGSYYPKTDFEFESAERTTTIAVEVDGDVVRLSDITTINRTSGERFEWDVGGGIYVLPDVAILGGYKKVRQDFDQTFTVTNALPPTTDPDVRSFSIVLGGPTIGIAASVPISSGFGFYASYAHGFMDVEISEPLGEDRSEVEEDGDYNVAELGFTYTHGTTKQWAPHMPLSAATAYVGYRYQIIETDLNEPDQDRTDITKGFAAGINLSF